MDRDGKKWKSSGRVEEKDALALRLLLVVSRQGQSTNQARMFLTWYQVNARHPRGESLLKKTRKNSATYKHPGNYSGKMRR